MVRKWHKRGIYFTLEAIIAMMILSVGFGIILFLFFVLGQPPVQNVQTELYDTVEIFSIEMNKISEGTCSAASPLVDDGTIGDLSLPLFTQVGEFYYRSQELGCVDCTTYGQDCITDFIVFRNMVDDNIEVRIEDSVIYSGGSIAQENATVLFPYKLLLFGAYNNSIWGPYVGEVRVWR